MKKFLKAKKTSAKTFHTPSVIQGVGICLAVLLSGTLVSFESGQTGKVEEPEDVYLVQLNSFKEKTNATRFVNNLKKKGYNPFILTVGDKEPWHKVRIGPYASEEEAERVVGEIKSAQGISGLIIFAKKISPKSSGFQNADEPAAARENADSAGKSNNVPTTVPEKNQDEVVDTVVSSFFVWLKSVEENNFDSYLSFYAKDFKGEATSRAEWEKAQQAAIGEKGDTEIEVSDVNVLKGEDTIEMSFMENFRSEKFSGIIRKTLVWKREGDRWKIISESGQPA